MLIPVRCIRSGHIRRSAPGSGPPCRIRPGHIRCPEPDSGCLHCICPRRIRRPAPDSECLRRIRPRWCTRRLAPDSGHLQHIRPRCIRRPEPDSALPFRIRPRYIRRSERHRCSRPECIPHLCFPACIPRILSRPAASGNCRPAAFPRQSATGSRSKRIPERPAVRLPRTPGVPASVSRRLFRKSSSMDPFRRFPRLLYIQIRSSRN